MANFGIEQMSRKDIDALLEVSHDEYRKVCEENMALRQAIKQALFFLKDATPRTRNGPCVRAIETLKKAVPGLD